MSKGSAARLRPLMVRPGARFACFGDGLCCTNIHALGPLTRPEVLAMRKLAPESVAYDRDVEAMALKPRASGGCHFLRAGRCQVHAKHGPTAKPIGCQRFPFGLVATPDGGRVTTEHRCPCRTLGDRPPIDAVEAEASLKNRGGRLEPDGRVPDRIALTAKRRVSFARYAALEHEILQRLARGQRAERALGARPLPPLHESSWPALAAEFFDMQDGTAGGDALGWFGDALLSLSAGHSPPPRKRPWSPSYDRAMARATEARDPEEMLNDWVADELWMFRWIEWCPFDVARAELATRVAVARRLQAWLNDESTRADRAMAEAITIVEIATVSSQWPEAVDAIAEHPSPG